MAREYKDVVVGLDIGTAKVMAVVAEVLPSGELKLAGLGVAGLPSYVIEDALMENALERVLPEWRLFSASLWAAMPTRRFRSRKT